MKKTTAKTSSVSFDVTATKFREFHSNGLNVFLHLITTPAMLVAIAVSLILLAENKKWLHRTLVLIYAMSLPRTMGVVKKTMTTTFHFDEGDQRKRGTKYKGTTLLFTWISLVGMSLLSEYLVEFKYVTNLKQCTMLFACGYVGQELAHAITFEKTYQQSYMSSSKENLQNWQ